MSVLRRVLHSKIHRATVTHADLHYEGSITISPELLDAADIHQYEAVQVWNVTNGQRFETYAIQGEAGSGDICVNGAAARLVAPGDVIIIACFSQLPESELAGYKPRVVFVDADNRICDERAEIPGPKTAAPTCTSRASGLVS